MRVVHIGHKYGENNTGGAAIAATRLHKALLDAGVESHYICIYKCEDGTNVHELPNRAGIARYVFLLLTKISRCIWKFTSYKSSIPLHIVPLFGLQKLLAKIKPDIIHIHRINEDVMSLAQLRRLQYKVVLNLHDLYMINILNPHPNGDLRYIEGLTYSNATFLERWLFNRKCKAVAGCHPIFIGPSKWVCDCANKSIIGRKYPRYEVSNIIGRCFERNIGQRKTHEKFVILYGGQGGRKNRYKGFNDLERALDILPVEVKKNSEVWIFGEMAIDTTIAGINAHFLGTILKPDDLIRAYHSADVFAFPSYLETQGMTKVEALLCGVPVVAFNRTACAEYLAHKTTGWIANDSDTRAYADGLVYFYRKWKDNAINHKEIAAWAASVFSHEAILRKLFHVYGCV